MRKPCENDHAHSFCNIKKCPYLLKLKQSKVTPKIVIELIGICVMRHFKVRIEKNSKYPQEQNGPNSKLY